MAGGKKIKLKQIETIPGVTGSSSPLKGWTVTTPGGQISKSVNAELVDYLPDGLKSEDAYCIPSGLPQALTWKALANNGSRFVAIADSSNVAAYSDDGVNWAQTTMPVHPTNTTLPTWKSVAWNGNAFFAVAANNEIGARSTDGITWTRVWLPTGSATVGFDCVTAIGTKFVAAGSGKAAYSTNDGVSWVSSIGLPLPASSYWKTAVWAGDYYVSVGAQTGVVATSPDGIVWTSRATLASNMGEVAFNSSIMVAISGGQALWASDNNGVSWYSGGNAPYIGAEGAHCILWTGTSFIAQIRGSSYVLRSVDGKIWDKIILPVPFTGQKIVKNDTCILMAAEGNGTLLRSVDDGLTWSQVAVAGTMGILCVSDTGLYCVTSSTPSANAWRSAVSTDGLNWTYSSYITGNYVDSVCYGNGKFVAVGTYYNFTIISTDGLNWTVGTGATDKTSYGGSVFAAQGYFFCLAGRSSYAGSNRVSISLDGNTWISRAVVGELPASQAWKAVTSGNGKFIAIANSSSNCSTSSDGLNWDYPLMPSSTAWQAITFNGTVFCAISNTSSTIAATSADGGQTWTSRTLSAISTWIDIASNPSGTMVAISGAVASTVASYSIDNGVSWTACLLPIAATWTAVCWGNGQFVAVANGTNFATSPDGITWTTRANGLATSNWSDVSYGNGVYCAVSATSGTAAATSPDGITWTLRTLSATTTWYWVHYSPKVGFVATSSASLATISVSPDGVTWTTRTMPVAAVWIACWDNTAGDVVAITNTNTIAAKTDDGITWERLVPSEALAFKGAGSNSNALMSVAASSTFAYGSSDGKSWKRGLLNGTAVVWSAATYVNMMFYLSSTTANRMQVSGDGVHWNTVGSGASTIIAGNQVVIIARSAASTISISSNDGLSFGTAYVPVPGPFTASGFNGVVFCLIGGSKTVVSNVVLTSQDGRIWTKSTMPSSNNWVDVIWNGVIFCAIAYNSNVSAVSADGVNWVEYANLPVTSKWSSITWGNGVFCIISETNGTTAATSPDGIIWSAQIMPSTQQWSCITFAMGYFYAASASSTSGGKSSDGVSWTGFTYSYGAAASAIRTNGTAIIVTPVGATTSYNCSLDGTSWFTGSFPVAASYLKVAVTSNGTFVATTATDLVAVSTDGVTWKTNYTTPTVPALNAIDNQGARLVGVGATGVTTFTDDGVNWLARGAQAITYAQTLSAKYVGGKYFITSNHTAAVGTIQVSDNGRDWVLGYTPATIKAVSIAWNGTLFCAVTSVASLIITSPDGIRWTQRPLGVSVILTAIAWNGSVFCAVSSGTTVAVTSSDGITWTQQLLPVATTWSAIAWNGSIFCAVASNSSIAATSIDGVTWTQQILPVSGYWRVTVGESIFCLVSYGQAVSLVSSDGVTWSQGVLPLTGNWDWVTWNGSVYCTVAYGNASYLTSSNGIDWVQRTSPNASGSAVMSNGNKFVLPLASATTVYESTDGISWQNVSSYNLSPQIGVMGDVSCTTTKAVALPNVTTNTSVMASSDDYSWTVGGKLLDIRCVAYGNGRYVAMIYGCTVCISSSDGVNWVQNLVTAANVGWQAIAWNGIVFCAITTTNTVAATSPDGITWTQRALPASAAWQTIVWNGSVFCAIAANSNIVVTSPDGITWTQRTMPISTTWKGLVWSGSVYCAISQGEAAAISSDGITWRQTTLPVAPSGGWQAIAWNGSVFCVIATNNSNIAATSPDGITWTQRTLPVSTSWYAIAWNGSVFCAVTQSNVAATSPDGITWTLRTLKKTAAYKALCVTPTNKFLVVGSGAVISDGSYAPVLSVDSTLLEVPQQLDAGLVSKITW